MNWLGKNIRLHLCICVYVLWKIPKVINFQSTGKNSDLYSLTWQLFSLWDYFFLRVSENLQVIYFRQYRKTEWIFSHSEFDHESIDFDAKWKRIQLTDEDQGKPIGVNYLSFLSSYYFSLIFSLFVHNWFSSHLLLNLKTSVTLEGRINFWNRITLSDLGDWYFDRIEKSILSMKFFSNIHKLDDDFCVHKLPKGWKKRRIREGIISIIGKFQN